jgi:acyl-CoA dehydrogenase
LLTDFDLEYYTQVCEQRTFPEDFWNALGSRALFAMLAQGTSLSEFIEKVVELSRNVGTLSYLFIAQNIATLMIKENFEEAQSILPELFSGKAYVSLALSERESGNDAFSLACQAKKENNEFLITGKKDYVTNAQLARFIIVVTRTSQMEKKSLGLTALLVDTQKNREKIRFTQIEKMGLDFLKLYSVEFKETSVPETWKIGKENHAWEVLVKYFNIDRLALAAMLVGMGETALKQAVSFARKREVFGKPIGSYQALQLPLAECAIELSASLALIHESLKRESDPKSKEFGAVALACYAHALKASQRAIDVSLQTLGAQGYLRRSALQALYRDVRYYAIGPLSQELVLANYAEKALGLPRSY